MTGSATARSTEAATAPDPPATPRDEIALVLDGGGTKGAFEGTPFRDAIDAFVNTRTRPAVPGGDPDPDGADLRSASSHHWNWRRFTDVLAEQWSTSIETHGAREAASSSRRRGGEGTAEVDHCSVLESLRAAVAG
jgi:hypothetical protein